MRLKFNVRAQQIFRADRIPLASDSRLYIAATAGFDSEWDDITARWLTFEPRTGTAITAVLADGSSFEESLGVSLSAGTWRVSAHGSNSAGKEIHTTPVLLNVAQAGGRDGEAPPYVPPDAAGQIAAVAAEARDIAQSVRDDADAGLFKGDKGDKGDAFEYADFTSEQLAALKGDKGDKGDAFEYSDFTPEQLAALKGDKGDTGAPGAAGQSAYAAAQAGGYTDTEANFYADLAAMQGLSGGQVQSDYAQNDPTAKDYIKNRPGGYETGFEITWDGDTTGRASATAEGAPYVWYKVSDKILTADDIIGATVTAVENGVSQSFVVTSDMIIEQEYGYVIGYSYIFIAAKTGDFNGMHIPEPGVYFLNASADGFSVNVSSLSTIIPIPFDDKYIPDSIARKDKVYTKDEVYTKNEIYTNYSHTMSITWDGNTDGKDTFVWNAYNFYKISDDVPVFKRIQSVSTSRSIGSLKSTDLYEGENCYCAGFSIVVTKAGACKLAANQGGAMQSFTAPSTGIYFWTNNGAYQTSLELTSFIEQNGIIVNSASKKWKITVDDNGVISATEIPE